MAYEQSPIETIDIVSYLLLPYGSFLLVTLLLLLVYELVHALFRSIS